jgi:hypothetical protein
VSSPLVRTRTGSSFLTSYKGPVWDNSVRVSLGLFVRVRLPARLAGAEVRVLCGQKDFGAAYLAAATGATLRNRAGHELASGWGSQAGAPPPPDLNSRAGAGT